jgi:CHAT domain-containing protein
LADNAEARTEYSNATTKLSRMILGPAAQLLGGKRLLIVSDGALQYIPFEALPAPDGEESLESVPLIIEHEVVTSPSASVMAVLRRQFDKRTSAPKAVVILADPVFEKSDPRVKNAKSGQDGKVQRAAKERQMTGSRSFASIGTSHLMRSATDVQLRGSGTQWPRLVFTRQEAAAILAVAPTGEGMEALDFQANRATATSPALDQFRIIHFATHGLLNSEHPDLSGLVLSLVNEKGEPENGFLELQDIYNLSLTADLVVLSACETGLGKEVKGEGLVGLTRGFMYAGAGRVVASLWKVDDVATAEMMGRFYRGMLKEGLRPAAALRQAQMEMQKQKRWTDPYYWAAFTIQGDWN